MCVVMSHDSVVSKTKCLRPNLTKICVRFKKALIDFVIICVIAKSWNPVGTVKPYFLVFCPKKRQLLTAFAVAKKKASEEITAIEQVITGTNFNL